LIGTPGLAIPIDKYHGYWDYTSVDIQKLQQNIPSLIAYLKKESLNDLIDITAFSKALGQGLFFNSNIPIGYGVGSSGALCAALLDQFGIGQANLSLSRLKMIFSQMESFFHGTSSGIDPLVSYLDSPLLFGKHIKKITLQKANTLTGGTFFLIDTGIQRKAEPYIQSFLEKTQNEWFQKKCEAILLPLVEDAIQTFIKGQWTFLFSTMHELSLFQYRYFDFMIPDTFKSPWLTGLSSTNYKLKICGAGGGGFLLGVSNNYDLTKKELKNYSLIPFMQF